MRDELLERDNAIANLNSEIKTLTGENKTLVADLLECRPALKSVRDELKERDVAIAKLKTELAAGEVKQLPSPEPIKTVSGTVELLTVGTPGLVDYINSIDPKSGIKAKTIGNAITRHLKGEGEDGEGGKGKNLSSLESRYNFKYLGKVANSHQFSIPKL
ncbi:hypothetical protein [Planktothrix agardhii]|uniref:hypothetical protein n=1 Tax=Planktothrix agardhii TaxID=1160 RepID=UPI001F1924C3|nr:hypothetical protein [Planktothrix agardhii]MCF3578898.1 hypothetical protein [Planktothrix agardhii 1812]MCF3587882.1 hypothetical protein [Planktothrix agardhii 1803]